MTPDLDALLALANAATPPPWHPFQTSQDRASLLEGIGAMLDKGGDVFVYVTCDEIHPGDTEPKTVAQTGNGPNAHNNAAFIAAANPDTVKALIATLKAADARIEALLDVIVRDQKFWDDDQARIAKLEAVREAAADLHVQDGGLRAICGDKLHRLTAALAACDDGETM